MANLQFWNTKWTPVQIFWVIVQPSEQPFRGQRAPLTNVNALLSPSFLYLSKISLWWMRAQLPDCLMDTLIFAKPNSCRKSWKNLHSGKMWSVPIAKSPMWRNFCNFLQVGQKKVKPIFIRNLTKTTSYLHLCQQECFWSWHFSRWGQLANFCFQISLWW